MKDVHIIGGGLAGLSLAVHLRRQAVPVVVHEAGRYPRHRVCGEFILGVAPGTLRTLGVADALADAIRHEDCAWFIREKFAGTRHLPIPALAISRHRLDGRLAAMAVDAGVDLRCNDRRESPAAEGWVRACGRLRSGTGQWLGLKAHYENLPLRAGLEMHLGRGGYAGLAGIEDGRVNVCALLPGGAPASGCRAEQLPRRLAAIGLESLADRLRNASVDEGSITGVTHFDLGWQAPPQEEDAVVIGDHHAIIPPFTGAGMSMAFEAAARAAGPLVQWAGGALPWRDAAPAVRQGLAALFKRRMALASRLHPLLLNPIGQKALAFGLSTRMLPFSWIVRKLR